MKSPEEIEYIEALKKWTEVAQRLIEFNLDTIQDISEVMSETTNLFKRHSSLDSAGKSNFKITGGF